MPLGIVTTIIKNCCSRNPFLQILKKNKKGWDHQYADNRTD